MALSTKPVISECNELCRLDQDAIGAFNEAIDSIKETSIRESLIGFATDTERHVSELSGIVRRQGGKPPERTFIRGILRKTMTRVAGFGGTEAVLKTVRNYLDFVCREYQKRARMDLPKDVLSVIQTNCDEKQRHVSWIEETLKTRTWEQAPAAHP